MATIERQIDALGGTHNETTEYGAGYSDGYSFALEAAMEIGAKADGIILDLRNAVRALLDAYEYEDQTEGENYACGLAYAAIAKAEGRS